MLLQQLRARVTEAVRAKDDVVRDVLRLAIGEIQTAEARASQPLDDEAISAILRKLVKSNEETLAAAPSGAGAANLQREIAALVSLLPKTLSVEQIVVALASQRDAIRAAKSDGQATGMAMKHLKTTAAPVEGTDVATAVKAMRA
jgi:uncharacterized protein YqeY